MGFFTKLISKLGGGSADGEQSEQWRQSSRTQRSADNAAEFTISVTYSGPSEPAVEISDAEVAEVASRYEFIHSNEPAPLKAPDRWWDEATQKRRARDGSDKALAWLGPFVSAELVKREQLRSVEGEWGPVKSPALIKELRALVRERRKQKQAHNDLLRALYGACVMNDFLESLEFENTGSRTIAGHVDINELKSATVDYLTIGYSCIESLGKTDIKWLTEAFGEPMEHQSFDALFPAIRQNAVRRYCWSELRESNEPLTYVSRPTLTMEEWLRELVRRNIGYHKEWKQRVAARTARIAEEQGMQAVSWGATRQTFVVADLETTGLNAESDEILEIAAVRVSASGDVEREFSVLVRPSGPIPEIITQLTGITDAEVSANGLSLHEAFRAFLSFVGPCPVFFHNAPFDESFLRQSAARLRQQLQFKVHDTLPMVRAAWPSLGTYKLSMLARHVGAPEPTHRAMADARATLAVLLSARALVKPTDTE